MKNTITTNEQLTREVAMFGQPASEIRKEFTDDWSLDVICTLEFARLSSTTDTGCDPRHLLNIAKMRLDEASLAREAREVGDYDRMDTVTKAMGLMSDLQEVWSDQRFELLLDTIDSLSN